MTKLLYRAVSSQHISECYRELLIQLNSFYYFLFFLHLIDVHTNWNKKEEVHEAIKILSHGIRNNTNTGTFISVKFLFRYLLFRYLILYELDSDKLNINFSFVLVFNSFKHLTILADIYICCYKMIAGFSYSIL